MSEIPSDGAPGESTWPWPVTVFLDCTPELDDRNRFVAINFTVSLGQPGEPVDAGRMDLATLHEGVRLTQQMLKAGDDEGSLEDTTNWLWESLDALPGAIEQLQEQEGPWHGFEDFTLSVMAPDEVALLPWEQLQPPVVRRTVYRPPMIPSCTCRLDKLGSAFTHGLGVPFFVPLDHLQLEGRLLNRRDGSPGELATETDEQAYDLVILNYNDAELDEGQLQQALAGRGVGVLAALLPEPDPALPQLDGLLRLQRAAVIGAGVPVVFGNRHPVAPAEGESALEGFIEQALKGIPLGLCAKNIREEHGPGWVLWSNIWDQPFLSDITEEGWQVGPHNPSDPLTRGQAGASVRALQQRLERLGLSVGPGRCDGCFGPDTERAVIVLQRVAELEPDGVVDEETRAAMDILEEEAGSPPLSGVIPRGYRPYRDRELLGPGSAGPNIDALDREAEALFDSDGMRVGLLDREACHGWAVAQEALGEFPAMTLCQGSLPMDLAFHQEGEGELRWLPRWLIQGILGALPNSGDGSGPVLHRGLMERLLECGLTAPSTNPDEPASVTTRAAMELLLNKAAELDWVAPMPALSPAQPEPEEQPAEQPLDQELLTEDPMLPVKIELEVEPQELSLEDTPTPTPIRLTNEEEEAAILARVALEKKVPAGILANREEGLQWDERHEEDTASGAVRWAKGLHAPESKKEGEEPKLPTSTREVEALITAEVEAAERRNKDNGSGKDNGSSNGDGNGNGSGESQVLGEMPREWATMFSWSGQVGTPRISTRPVVKVEDDSPLDIPNKGADLERVLGSLHERFSFPRELTAKLLAELQAGRHVILTGPSGTGKTCLAKAITRALGYYPVVTTPSADWTTFETVGGLLRLPSNSWAGQAAMGELPEYAFRPGVVLEAVLGNWEELPAASGPGVRWVRTGRGVVEPGGRAARGWWLVLDELNRGDIDLVLGGVFTALESRRFRIPAAVEGWGSQEIPIPRDFRIIATLNVADRQTLFRISNALKRRFAFIEVPVTQDLAGEWRRVANDPEVKHLAGQAKWQEQLSAEDAALLKDLRKFIYLTRIFHPLGTAQLLAATRFIIASTSMGLLGSEVRLQQAMAGSVLPGLEGIPPEILHILQVWAAPASDSFELKGGTQPGLPSLDTVRQEVQETDPLEDLETTLTINREYLQEEQELLPWLATLDEGWLTTEQPREQSHIRLLARSLVRESGPYEELAQQLWHMAKDSALG